MPDEKKPLGRVDKSNTRLRALFEHKVPPPKRFTPRRELTESEVILQRFVDNLVKSHDHHPAMGTGEFKGAPPCSCVPCTTYREALEYFERKQPTA